LFFQLLGCKIFSGVIAIPDFNATRSPQSPLATESNLETKGDPPSNGGNGQNNPPSNDGNGQSDRVSKLEAKVDNITGEFYKALINFNQTLADFRTEFKVFTVATEGHFKSIDDKFKSIEDKMVAMEKRFDDKLMAMEKRFDDKLMDMEKRFSDKLENLEKRLEGKIKIEFQSSKDITKLAVGLIIAFEVVIAVKLFFLP
jgi:hypothetical protein